MQLPGYVLLNLFTLVSVFLPAENENGSVSDVSKSWIAHFLPFRTFFLATTMDSGNDDGGGKSSSAMGVFGLFFRKYRLSSSSSSSSSLPCFLLYFLAADLEVVVSSSSSSLLTSRNSLAIGPSVSSNLVTTCFKYF